MILIIFAVLFMAMVILQMHFIYNKQYIPNIILLFYQVVSSPIPDELLDDDVIHTIAGKRVTGTVADSGSIEIVNQMLFAMGIPLDAPLI